MPIKTVGIFLAPRQKTEYMTEALEYEMLKAHLIKTYSAYINAVQNSTFEDLQSLDKQLPLMNTYVDTVKSNAKFRDFIHKHGKAEISNKPLT